MQWLDAAGRAVQAGAGGQDGQAARLPRGRLPQVHLAACLPTSPPTAARLPDRPHARMPTAAKLFSGIRDSPFYKGSSWI